MSDSDQSPVLNAILSLFLDDLGIMDVVSPRSPSLQNSDVCPREDFLCAPQPISALFFTQTSSCRTDCTGKPHITCDWSLSNDFFLCFLQSYKSFVSYVSLHESVFAFSSLQDICPLFIILLSDFVNSRLRRLVSFFSSHICVHMYLFVHVKHW